MQYNSHASSQDIISQISLLTDTNTDEYSLADRTRNANVAYHKAVAIIQRADGLWQFDDANNTTLPIATTTLTADQRDYQLQDDMIELERVEVKDSNGLWRKLLAIDQSEVPVALDEFQKTSGNPMYYDKLGRTIYLYPASNVTVADGLKIRYKRPANIFTTTDTTKEPGFDAMWHDYIPTYAALVYCELYKPKRVAMLLDRLNRMEKDMLSFYGRRSKDTVTRIIPRINNAI
jgi:hypothetical protein